MTTFRTIRLTPTTDTVLDQRTGLKGELFFDITNQTLRLYDGELRGGREILLADLSNIDVAILNSKLANSTVTVGTTTVQLGSSTTTLAGLTSVTATTFNGALTGAVTGNASTATKLETARTINGVDFDGSANIVVSTIAHQTEGVLDGGISVLAGGALSFGAMAYIRPLMGGQGNELEITTNETLNPNGPGAVKLIVASTTNNTGLALVDQGRVFLSAFTPQEELPELATNIELTPSVITVNGAVQFNNTITATVTGSVSGNAGTVTNGVVTTGTYANPSWITSLALSKVGFTASNSFTYNAGAGTALSIKKSSAVLEFGSLPVSSKSFTIVDANVQATNAVSIIPLGSDEWEMDPISYSAQAYDGGVTVFASTAQGPVKGPRSVYYTLA